MAVLNADCPRIAAENPVNIISGHYISKWFPDLQEKHHFPVKWTQQIHPWQFGDSAEKTTCLWLKGLPPLTPTNIVSKGEFKEFVSKKGVAKRQPMWYFEALSSKDRAKVRSKTFPGIAQAMARQWSAHSDNVEVSTNNEEVNNELQSRR